MYGLDSNVSILHEQLKSKAIRTFLIQAMEVEKGRIHEWVGAKS